ncbi:hypothetical protein N7509_013345 [Penicillium cosmopolitanum]|uniref:NADP-dependent oxidoreductase domain-containing protein n=1 Tax=Penicillium cosmopolitanum TaxID=1131564 RepID=A0A9W9SFU9_9EURO|nr:uncharacterized protein N7509_013345 [Penicillium cosmopolitanum]KAJ5376459.1 hypothetical protein N7509_013345 [Penicillium cosmopolitanum]
MSCLPAGVAKSLDETKADYRLLGNSGLRVSVPIIGCWVLGPEKALPLLKGAYDRGVTTIRTLVNYIPGLTSRLIYLVGYGKHLLQQQFRERVIAEAIRKYSLPRHRLVLMAKTWSRMGEQQFHTYPILDELRQTKDYINQFGLSRSALFTAVNDSLARLETDYIDVFWIHRFDPYTPIEETMRALRDLVTYGGKFGYIGASSILR